MSHILKGLSKRNTHIPHIVLYDEDKWQKVCSNAYFGFFTGGGHFWRMTLLSPGHVFFYISVEHVNLFAGILVLP